MTTPQLPNAITGLDSDQDNADTLVQYFGKYIRYAADSRLWYVWQDDRWVMDPEALIITGYWTQIARKIEQFIPAPTQRNQQAVKPNPHYKYSLSRRGMEAAVAVARKDPKIQLRQSEFDSRPYELNTPNGIVDLRTAITKDCKPECLHTSSTALSPNPGPFPLWSTFLKDTFQGDTQIIDYVQLILGSALIGEVVEQKFYYAFGPQGTGKSTFFNVVQSLLGDYVRHVDCRLIVKGKERHPEEIVKLQGKRLIIMAEPDASDSLDVSKLKWLTGGDMLEGRHMGKGSFDFRPSHSMFLYGNYLLNVSSKSEGIYRRMSLVPFENQVWDQQKAVSKYEDTLLREEGPQILQWLVDGAQKYLNQGKRIDMPLHLQLLVREYEEDQDLFGQFFNERLDLNEKGSITHKELMIEYNLWADELGLTERTGKLGPKSITQAMTSKKYGTIRKQKTKDGAKFVGVRLGANASTMPSTW